MRKKSKNIIGLAALSLLANQAVWAGDGSTAGNSFAWLFITLMVVLLIVIAVLANKVISDARFNLKSNGKRNISAKVFSLTLVMLLSGSAVFAQNAEVATKTTTILGMTSTMFYILLAVILIELVVIISLLLNISTLSKMKKVRELNLTEEEKVELRQNNLTWWDKFNSFRPVSQETEIDLGHEYDGIRELNNRLPGWWIYGFYFTIIFAGIYMWRYHVSHSAPSSEQEYKMAIAQAELQTKEFLKSKGEDLDESNVTFLTAAADLDAGKTIFVKSCAACHQATGAGLVGPNLTDNYWLHGNDAKSVFKTVRYGINAMPQWKSVYSNKQIQQVVSYVKSLHGTNPPNPKAPQGVEVKEDATAAVSAPADSTKK